MRVCEGECNSDNDCDGDLVCFVRRANEPVPGCSGTISRSTNVCIRPITPESRVTLVQAIVYAKAIAIATQNVPAVYFVISDQMARRLRDALIGIRVISNGRHML